MGSDGLVPAGEDGRLILAVPSKGRMAQPGPILIPFGFVRSAAVLLSRRRDGMRVCARHCQRRARQVRIVLTQAVVDCARLID